MDNSLTGQDIYIALIGAGQIGSRHLQALARLERKAKIQVVDPSPESLLRVRQRWNEAISDLKPAVVPELQLLERMSGLNPRLDVAIVATNSDVRRAVVEELLTGREVRFLILEKVVFQSDADFAAVGDLLAARKTQAWVNCASRMLPGYHDLRAKSPTRLRMHVSGTQWGLACNSIHFIDLLHFFTGEAPEVLAGELLDPGSFPSKRPGFVELSGTLTARAGRSFLSLTSFREGNAPVALHLSCPEFQAWVRPALSRMWLAEAASDWTIQEKPFAAPMQSQLTHLAVSGLLDRGTCELTDFQTSRNLHRPFLHAIAAHLQLTSSQDGASRCPIT